MNEAVKQIDLLNLSDKSTLEIRSVPPSIDDNPEPEPGRQVLVQTQRAKDLNFHILLEIIDEKQGKYVGKVVGEEGYQGPRDTIYPSEYLKFEFDGLTLDDLVWFEKKNVWQTL